MPKDDTLLDIMVGKSKADCLTKQQDKSLKNKKTCYPFSCGSEYADWHYENCEQGCKHYRKNPDKTCKIDRAILRAYMTDGKTTEEIRDLALPDCKRFEKRKYIKPLPKNNLSLNLCLKQ